MRHRIPLLLLVLAVGPFAPKGADAYTPPPLFRSSVNLQPAWSCKPCHIDITEQWERSAHSKADRGQNLLFGRMYFYSLKQTRGETMVACGPCHETSSFVNQDFEGLREVSAEGVNCVFCHSIDGPSTTGVPPYSLEVGPYTGTLRNPMTTPSHKSKHSSFLATSEYCGGCHKYSNQYGVPISDTYGEWKRSKYAKQGLTCQGCHMPGAAGRNAAEGPVRPRVADHSFSHEDLATRRPNAALLKLRGERRGDSLRFHATVTNAGWGHSLPTGNDQNLVLIRVRVKSAEGEILWENDPFADWDVSVFGVTLADEFGRGPADTWNARSVVADRRIKAGQSADVRYDAPLGGAKGALRVEAQLLYRRARPETVTLYGLPEAYDTERLLAETSLSVP
ncbi:MAG TPA: multiheme c-type cytochrome [Candidatus Eisenbacteria bacterium]|nr:multiheme c-type cytochrome [Candidatus Eisenbacteria bacterium]